MSTTVRQPRHAPRHGTVGASLPRVDGRTKARGRMRYTGDWALPELLEVAVARSTRAHAVITGIDVAAATAIDGVVAVVTGEQIASELGDRHRTGPAFSDQPILAHERVRYHGEPVVAVVARDRRTARRAAAAVRIQYEDLPPILDVDAAVAGAPYVHDELRPATVFKDLAHLTGQRDTNVCMQFNLRRGGDIDAAIDESAHAVTGEFWTPPVVHTPIELPCTVGWVEADRLELVSTTQTPSYVRQCLAGALALPLHRVRVRVPHLGGGFGAKMYDRLEPLVGYLAWRLQRPVRQALSRDEAFVLTTRHGVAVSFQMAADAEGRLTVCDADVRYDTGAYADIGPRIAAKSGLVATGPYRCENAAITSRCVYTNKPSAGPYRGFGVPQVVWAHECMIDDLARAAGRDPYAMRRENLLRESDEHATGTPMHSADLVGCLDGVAGALDWTTPLPVSTDARWARGRGVAVGLKAVLTPTISGAIVQLNQDASATVAISTVDMGQGSDTIMAQIAAEVLAIDPARVRVVDTDTNVTPYDTITAGSRSTYHMGNAVRLAAQDTRRRLLQMAAEVLDCDSDPDALTLEADGVHRDGEPALTIPALMAAFFGAAGTTVTGEATYRTSWVPYDHDTGQTPQVAEHWFAGAVGAEVTVDRLTGRLTVDHLAVAADVGRAVNPGLVRQQLEGAAMMGLGHALFDELVLDDQGRVVNPSLLDYQMPSVRDVPARLTSIIVEDEHRSGPFGAKGVGETGLLSLAPAVRNAVLDATGVALYRLPLTPESILAGLDALGGASA